MYNYLRKMPDGRLLMMAMGDKLKEKQDTESLRIIGSGTGSNFQFFSEQEEGKGAYEIYIKFARI